ncbi:MAG TPA: hypothetical protein VHO50_12975 [Bacteroidales bacterium]|nr:hypothetical protein [Bacteroidales bacterium]
MNNMLNRSKLLFCVIFTFMYSISFGQTTIPEELRSSPVRDQLNYIENRTKIYENFRAVREDMFQVLKTNINDTIASMQQKVAASDSQVKSLNHAIDTLERSLASTKTDLENMTRTKDSVEVLGMEIRKDAYNTLMFSIIIALLLILVLGFLVFKRNQRAVINRNKDIEELKAEFETYRKTSREAREKMALQHFNELKRLRGE